MTEILWDKWGVPHIYAEDEVSASYGCGWAHAHSHGDLILRLYAQARGNAASIYGAALLESDKKTRIYDIAGHTERWYTNISERGKASIHAYVDGINAYSEAYPDNLNAASHAVLPITAKDCLAHYIRAIYFNFIWNELKMDPYLRVWQQAKPGSNAWVIAPSATKSGNAMILGNPHLMWSDLFLFYELHVVTPDYWAYGTSLVGMIGIGIGFNEHLAWTHTVNTYHGLTLYELQLEGDGYNVDGEIHDFETDIQTIIVRHEDGTHREEIVHIRRSKHGPVIREKAGKAIALRVAGLDVYRSIDVWPDMVQATTFSEFHDVLKRMNMPMFNTLYADREGNIMEFFGGNVPVRNEGDWDFWFNIVPGNRSDLIWNEYHGYDDVPCVINPESGWLTNSNEPPWYMTQPYPLKSMDFPAYLAPPQPKPYSVSRPQVSQRMILDNLPMTYEKMVELKFYAGSDLPARIFNDLLSAARASNNPIAHQCADVLEAWDQQFEPDSRGAVLFHLWYEPYWMQTFMRGNLIFADNWDDDAPPMTLPRGLKDKDEALRRLIAAAERMRKHGLELDAPWGQVVRMRVGQYNLPARGGPGTLNFRMLEILPTIHENGQMYVYHGDAFIYTLEFSNPMKVNVLMTYGNSTQAHTGHVGDQLPLYARNEMRTPWLSREDIEANLERHDELG